MKKKLLFLLPLLTLSMASCSPSEGEVTNYTNTNNGLVKLCQHIVDDSYITFIRDTYTDNIYMKCFEKHGYGGGGSLSPYYNAEGQIMKYSEFVEVHKH